MQPDGSLLLILGKCTLLPECQTCRLTIIPADDYFITELLSTRRPQFANDTSNISNYPNSAATPVETFAAFAHIPIVGEE